MTAHLWFWAAVGLQIAALIALAATVYGYSREVSDLRAERDADYAEMAARIDALTPTDPATGWIDVLTPDPTTGPINVPDRPTPAQIAAPTVPDLQAQHPAPNADSYGRHASAA